MFEGVQLVDVAGNRVVQVLIRYDLLKPCTDFDHAIMHPALKLSLDGFQLRRHPFLRSDPPDGHDGAHGGRYGHFALNELRRRWRASAEVELMRDRILRHPTWGS